jgi:hypothetical protein
MDIKKNSESASKAIGPAFSDDLKVASLMGLPFAWGDDGTFSFDESMDQRDIERVMAVYEAHTPNVAAID